MVDDIVLPTLISLSSPSIAIRGSTYGPVSSPGEARSLAALAICHWLWLSCFWLVVFHFYVFGDGNVISTYINHPRNVLMIQAITQAITKILEKKNKPVNIAIRSFQMLVIVGLCLCVDCASSMTWERCGCKVCQIYACALRKTNMHFWGYSHAWHPLDH